MVKRAVKILNSRETIEFKEDEFADLFGVTARHLRRLFIEEVGKTPKQLSFENRLNLARKLIAETQLPITEIAFASGFSSIRRFNSAFKDRFKRPPSEIRRQKTVPDSGLRVSLPYRPPFDFEGLLHSYEKHQIGNLEWFENGKMYRIVSSDRKIGQVSISNDAINASLIVEIDFPDTSLIHSIISRVRNLFDLDSDPVIIANALETDPEIKKLLRKCPGIRLPSGWDPFEIAISTILGQLVSVSFGRTLVHDLIEIAGRESGHVANGKNIKLFPTPLEIMKANLSGLKTTRMRRQTLIDFATAVHEQKISLEPTQDVGQFINNAQSIKGIGSWTANYMAMKVLRSTDTFPEGDLILARALQKHSKESLEAMSPWKGYVASLFWRSYSQSLSRVKRQEIPNGKSIRKNISL